MKLASVLSVFGLCAAVVVGSALPSHAAPKKHRKHHRHHHAAKAMKMAHKK